jgi:hypothetical protein
VVGFLGGRQLTSRLPRSIVPLHLTHFAMWTAFPSSDYY